MPMDLSDYNPPYLLPGDHLVTVTKHEYRTNNNTGNKGIEFTVHKNGGSSGRLMFWLTDKAKGFLAEFCIACGLTPEQRRNWEPTDCYGKMLVVTAFKNEKGYSEIKHYRAATPAEIAEDARKAGLPSFESPVMSGAENIARGTPDEPGWLNDAPRPTEPPDSIDPLPF